MVAPTAPPRCLPPWYSMGTVKVPFTVMLPPSASAAAATSRNARPGPSPPLTRKRSPTRSIRSGLLASRGAEQDVAQFLPGVDRGVAHHERNTGGIRAVVLRRHRAIGGDDAQASEIDTDDFSHGLGENGGRSLADIGRPGQDGDAAIEVEPKLHHRVRLAGAGGWRRGAGGGMGGTPAPNAARGE